VQKGLQKFLGKVNYLRRFIANLFTKIVPLVTYFGRRMNMISIRKDVWSPHTGQFDF
jgi:hypothetical protein